MGCKSATPPVAPGGKVVVYMPKAPVGPETAAIRRGIAAPVENPNIGTRSRWDERRELAIEQASLSALAAGISQPPAERRPDAETKSLVVTRLPRDESSAVSPVKSEATPGPAASRIPVDEIEANRPVMPQAAEAPWSASSDGTSSRRPLRAALTAFTRKVKSKRAKRNWSPPVVDFSQARDTVRLRTVDCESEARRATLALWSPNERVLGVETRLAFLQSRAESLESSSAPIRIADAADYDDGHAESSPDEASFAEIADDGLPGDVTTR